MRTFGFLLAAAAITAAQSPEAGYIERVGDTAALRVESGRPVDSAAITLAESYGLRVNVEDPPYICDEDKVDVTDQVSRSPAKRRVLVPRTHSLEVRFPVTADGRPQDPAALIEELARVANQELPFAYRVAQSGGAWTLTPTRTRDQLCNEVDYLPLLDRPVTIPHGKRRIMESANLMAEALAEQTGVSIACCQSAIGGVPWGLEEIEFGAENEPARAVLERLIEATVRGRPNPYYWLLRCDPQPSPWGCALNLRQAP